MIRYLCKKCGYIRGGPEDKECPICGQTLVYKGICND